MQILEKNPPQKVAKKGEFGDFSKPVLPKNEGQIRPLIEQAEALKEAGVAKSDREAARKIAADTGETVPTVRHKIQRGEEEVAQRGPLIQTQSIPISKPVQVVEQIPQAVTPPEPEVKQVS